MKRALVIVEQHGIYTAETAAGQQQSRTLAGLLEKLDSGNGPERYEYAAGIIEKALGPKREGDHGQIQQGVVGA